MLGWSAKRNRPITFGMLTCRAYHVTDITHFLVFFLFPSCAGSRCYRIFCIFPICTMFLKLEQLQARELVDKGTFNDAQDPALEIRIGSEEFKTCR
jgi:hypothetical protein